MTTHSSILQQLMAVVEDRKAKRPANSYTTQLLDGGVDRIGAKIVEEAGELVEAAAEAGGAGREHFIREVSDLIFHLWVMLGYKDVSLDEVEAELKRRFGISGIDEKASRKKTEVL